MPAFYNEPKTLDDVINHSVGRALDLIGIDVGVVHRWAGRSTPTDVNGATE
jgi:flavin prenyltransferase